MGVLFSAFVAGAEAELLNFSTSQLFNSYTNHAGNAVAGWPVKLTTTHVALAEGVVANDYPPAERKALERWRDDGF